jgi:uncharacterized protein
MIEEKLKKDIITRVTKRCGKCLIYIFGSYAYGKPSSSSDLDIAVIVDTVDSSVLLSADLWKLLKDIPIPKDVVVASQKEFDFYKNEPGSLLKTIAEKGVLINV